MQTRKFSLEKDYLDNYTVKGSYGNEYGTYDSLSEARQRIDSLTEQFSANDCAWNGHSLDGLTVVEIENRLTTDRVCQEHQGLFVKSVNSLAKSNPTVRGNEVK